MTFLVILQYFDSTCFGFHRELMITHEQGTQEEK